MKEHQKRPTKNKKDKRAWGDKKKYPKRGTEAYRKLCEESDRGWATKIWSDD